MTDQDAAPSNFSILSEELKSQMPKTTESIPKWLEYSTLVRDKHNVF